MGGDQQALTEEVIGALEGMCLQYLTRHGSNVMETGFMSAGEDALHVLEKLGRVRAVNEVEYEWTEESNCFGGLQD